MTALQRERVRHFYDVNTSAFARFGQGTTALRRAVWAPGVATRQAAFRAVDALILQEIRNWLADRGEAEPCHVLDLGCGLGASLMYLATHAPIRGLGVTLSGVQAARAQAAMRAAGLAGRIACVQADFMSLPPQPTAAQFAFSIEAFVHAASPAGYFAAAAQQLAADATLIICDDVLAPRARGSLAHHETRCIAQFREGWHAASLVTEQELVETAQQAGFRLQSSLDLTAYLELQRPRDRLLRACLPLLAFLPIPDARRGSLVSGDALQRGLMAGLIEYKYMTFRLAAK